MQQNVAVVAANLCFTAPGIVRKHTGSNNIRRHASPNAKGIIYSTLCKPSLPPNKVNFTQISTGQL